MLMMMTIGDVVNAARSSDIVGDDVISAQLVDLHLDDLQLVNDTPQLLVHSDIVVERPTASNQRHLSRSLHGLESREQRVPC